MSPAILFAEIPSIQEFTAPVADQPSKGIKAPQEVENPGKIKVSKKKVLQSGEETTVVEAATTQDAINMARELKQDVSEIQVGSGRGIVASGDSSYIRYKNRTASLLSKRQAYVKALAVAKKNLREHISNLKADDKIALIRSMDEQVTADEPPIANFGEVSRENLNQRVEGILRGYAVYSIDDDLEQMTVRVTIVTTPKTCGETIQVDRSTVIAKNRKAALDALMVKLSKGFLPPIGSQVISVQPTNDLWFCGYGSAIIKTNRNKSLQRKLKANALEIARMRAANALIGMITGDKIKWESGLDGETAEAIKQFEEIEKEDPTSKKTSLEVKRLDSDLETFKSRMVKTDMYTSAQQGQLPPGIEKYSWIDDSGDWACAVSIYNADSTQHARKVQKVIESGPSILEKSESSRRTATYGSSNKGSAEVYRDDRPVGRGPSGQVSADDDL